jgi:uncharacterized OsmC-like protein
MKIRASVINYENSNEVVLQTNDNIHSIKIPPKANGFGSSANGGELLFLSLAVCYTNDIYREASKMNIRVEMVEVEVSGDFGSEGEPANNITYNVKVTANADEKAINELIYQTDKKAEIQNTLRTINTISLNRAEAVSKLK